MLTLQINFGLKDTNVRKRSVSLGVVKAVSYDKLVGDLKTYVVGSKFHLAAGGLVEQSAGLYAFCALKL